VSYNRRMRGVGTIVIVGLGLAATACVFDGHAHDRPARMHIGATSRHFAAPAGEPQAFRNTTPPPPTVLTTSHDAALFDVQFAMRANRYVYAGGEVETGVLDDPGSSTAAVYGVLGAELPLHGAAIAAELASGYRTVRYSTDTEDLGKLVVEPRLSAHVWMSPRLTLETTGGLTLGDQRVWMVGAYLGVHSHDFDLR